MAGALAIISKAVFEKLAGKQPKPGEVLRQLQRYDSRHAALEVLAEPGGELFLVTVRPDEALWLVAVLPGPKRDKRGWASWINNMPMTDISVLRPLLLVTAGAQPGKLAMSLQTPRVLSAHDEMFLRHVKVDAESAAVRNKPFTVKFPKWLLADAKASLEPAPQKKLKPLPPAKNPAPAKKKSKKDAATLPELIVECALAQIEEEIGGLQDDPAPYLKAPKWKGSLRGAFTESVQGVFAGALEPKEARRMLAKELAPFVDGPSMKIAKAAAKGDFEELVDQFAIRAIDELARGLVALALQRPDFVPACCAPYANAMEGYVEQVQELLDG
jgi:hypothetical protein